MGMEAAPSRTGMVLKRMSDTVALSGAINTPGISRLQREHLSTRKEGT